jgi:hypothetical protein
MPVQTCATRVFAALTAAMMTSSSALAQDVRLANLLPDLILRDIVLQSPPVPPGVAGIPEGFTHLAHFSPIEANELNNPVVGIVQSFNTQIATQFSTFPLGSSTGGLTYVFDESLGTFRRGSTSFGPSFAERALTIGRRRLNAGATYQRTSYDTFEGRQLDDGSIKFYLRHQDCCSVASSDQPPGFVLTTQANGTRLNPPFEGDLIEASLALNATTHTTALFANYGATDRWDIGLVVPFVDVKLDATVQARVLRTVTAVAPTVHAFDPANPDAERVVRRTGHASGLGDIVVRSRYHVLRVEGGGLAVAVDVRLPTGDQEQLLGTGGVQAKFLLIASGERGRFGQHVNVGYTAAEGTSPGALAGLASSPLPDEINYSGGIEFVVSPRLTVMGDFVGRTLRGAGRLELVSKPFEYNMPSASGSGCGGLPIGVCTTLSLDEFDPRQGDLTLLLGTAGMKFNPGGNWLISGSVLVPLTDAGLRSRRTLAVGVDYTF